MRILHRHLFNSYLIAFFSTLLVITFVMSIGGLFKVADLLARGVAWRPIVQIFLLGLPPAISFAVPVSSLTACLLLFGRLSSDNEIGAMKACGISMWQIISRPLLIAAGMALVCLYINTEVAPRCHLLQRSAIARIGVESPLEFLEEGRFIQDFNGLKIFIGKRRGQELTNVRINDLRKPGIHREIRAMEGTVVSNSVKELVLQLRVVRVEPFLDDRPGAAYFDRWTLRVPSPMNTGKYKTKSADRTLVELMRGIYRVSEEYPELSAEDLARQKSVLQVELHKRLVLALCSITFVLLGVPLGTKAHRKESSIGIAMSLGLLSVFYLFVILAQAMAKYPVYQPHWINWVPFVVSAVIGLVLIHRSN